ncbi:hypothetical protein C656_13195 [Enterococcus hirae 57-03-H11]|nr:hypothetical protein C656_13195 [Enterococcus hirae 57-03-H11]
MLVATKEIFEKAQKENYAIPAANFFDLDSARTFVEVAEKMQKPLILAFKTVLVEELLNLLLSIPFKISATELALKKARKAS